MREQRQRLSLRPRNSPRKSRDEVSAPVSRTRSAPRVLRLAAAADAREKKAAEVKAKEISTLGRHERP